ncbi:MAG TPA: thiamine phosphate synthase [Clostridiales bacterium]|nr:thiamine phosphate synthase [Clostridiales bacterium]
MCNIVCVTNRKLCKNDFLKQIELIASSGVTSIILREKDLSETEYLHLAREVISICKNANVECILHTFVDVVRRLNHPKIHLPLHILRLAAVNEFETVGCSIHSLDEAILAQRLGASYITAGHIFQTDCKKNVTPRGLSFLSQVVAGVQIPVFAIGGINTENAQLIFNCGAKAACMMSSFMTTNNPNSIIDSI